MWPQRASTTVLTILALTGCTWRIEASQFEADAVIVACEKAFECCERRELPGALAPLGDRPPASVRECEELLRRRLPGQAIQSSVAAGRAGYDDAAAQTCLDDARNAGCGELRSVIVDLGAVSGACVDAITPVVQEGGLCAHDYECRSGWCDGAASGVGTCARLPSAGEPCGPRCAPGLRCEGGTCAAFEPPPRVCDGEPG